MATGAAITGWLATSTGACAGGGACANTFECRDRVGNGSFCVDGACGPDVPALPDGVNCRVLEPIDGAPLAEVDWVKQGPYVVGGMFRDIGKEADPDGSDHPSGVKRHLATRLALQEINERGGLPGGERFGLLSCEYGTGKQVEGLDFMSSALGLNVVVASTSSGRTRTLVQHLVAQDPPLPTAFIATTATAPSLGAASLDGLDGAEHGLLWRIPPTDELQAVMLARVIAAEHAGGTVDALTIAFTEETYGQDLELEVRERLEGLDVAVERFGFDAESAPGTQLGSVQSLGEAGADAVLIIGSNASFAVGIVQELATLGATPARYYAPDGALSADTLLDPDLPDPVREALQRLVGSAPTHRRGPHWDSVRDALAAQFETGLDDSFLAHSYDGGYVAALALARAGRDGEFFDGRDVASSLAALTGGAQLQLGKSSWNDALDALFQEPNTLDVEGVSGPLDFDPSSGDATSGPMELWAVADDLGCFQVCQVCDDAASCLIDTEALDACHAGVCP